MEVWILERIVKKSQIKVSPEGEKRRAKMLAEGRCLGCGELITAGEGVKRGLHLRCYEAYRRGVSSGKTTEREMVRAGMMLDPSPGRRVSNPLAKILNGK